MGVRGRVVCEGECEAEWCVRESVWQSGVRGVCGRVVCEGECVGECVWGSV